MKPRLRWRKEPWEKGLAKAPQGTRGFDLCRSGEVLIRVRPTGFGGWYWHREERPYTLIQSQSFATADLAQWHAMTWLKNHEGEGK